MVNSSLIKRIPKGALKVFNNFSWLSFDSILRVIISFIVGLWFARLIGPDNYGIYSFAISFVALFSPFAKLGLDGVVVRNLVKEPNRVNETLGATFLLKCCSGLLVAIISATVILIYQPGDKTTQYLVGITSIGTIFLAFDTIDFWFQSQVQSKYSVIAKDSSLLLLSILRIVVLLEGGNIYHFALLSVVETAFSGIMLIILFKVKGNSIFAWKYSVASAKKLLTDSWPFILSGSFVLIYLRADQIFLKTFVDNRSLGLYATAVRLSEIWYFIPTVIVSSILPAITFIKQHNEIIYKERLQRLFDLVAWIAIIIGLVTTLFSNQIVSILFGPAYQGASKILSIYIWAGPFVFLGVARNPWILNENKARLSLITTFFGAFSNIILNFLLIPRWGGIGAAIATIISYAINSHVACFFVPEMRGIGWMLTKAMFIPFRIKQNIKYIKVTLAKFSGL